MAKNSFHFSTPKKCRKWKWEKYGKEVNNPTIKPKTKTQKIQVGCGGKVKAFNLSSGKAISVSQSGHTVRMSQTKQSKGEKGYRLHEHL